MAVKSHGLSKTPEYHCWSQIKARCLNCNSQRYPDYGGRGITVHPEWVHDFKAFYEHVGPKPSPDHSLDRINNEGNYEPGNVRWATWVEQAANCRPRRPGRRPQWPVVSGVERNGGLTNFRHGMSYKPEHRCWGAIKSRCFDVNHHAYDDYGGRGIRMHSAWIHDFQAFYNYVGPRPSPQHSLDRINNDGNYEPGNVRWATRAEQNTNRRPCRSGPSHANTRHGMTKTPEYRAWVGIHTRCFNSRSDRYPRYGGIGITVCSRWRNSFEEFFRDMGERPSSAYVMARMNTEGHYSCGQCAECEAQNWHCNCAWLSLLVRNQTRKRWEVTSQGPDGRFCGSGVGA
jgi:hypothetical protein